MRTKGKINDSAIVWQGLSALNGQPTVAIVTGISGRSANPKTGPMAQLYILCADVDPLTAVRTGQDKTICGDCGYRGTSVVIEGETVHGKNRGCYVTVTHAPRNIYATFKRDRYAFVEPLTVSERLARLRVPLRLGAYGDPAALPLHVIAELVDRVPRWTGYTHAWRSRPDLAPYVMASCDSPADKAAAAAMGFRSFRARLSSQPLDANEIACPASEEMAYRTSCDRCSLCNGSAVDDRRKHIAIIVHGSTTVHAVAFLRSKPVAAMVSL
jgi:hypothetical protein